MLNVLYQSCMCKRLSEDEPSYSKHVEDIFKNKKYINLGNVHFVGLYCIIQETWDIYFRTAV